jgi:predicted RNase H-like nuclease (RuvC/YqgF family)
VRYEAVNAMLLNEFLKEHRAVEEQKSAITQIKSALFQQDVMIRQQREIQTLSASLKEQTAQIEKVSNQLQLSKAPSQLIAS